MRTGPGNNGSARRAGRQGVPVVPGAGQADERHDSPRWTFIRPPGGGGGVRDVSANNVERAAGRSTPDTWARNIARSTPTHQVMPVELMVGPRRVCGHIGSSGPVEMRLDGRASS